MPFLMHNWRANRMQSRTCSSYAEVKPTIDEVNAQCIMHNWASAVGRFGCGIAIDVVWDRQFAVCRIR
jgi:hypothetical protein